jgi:hypothetical protein
VGGLTARTYPVLHERRMKPRDTIICLALLSLFLVLGDCVQHFGKVLEARVTLRNIRPDDQNFENVQDVLHRQGWSAAKDVVVMAAQGLVVLLMTKRQPHEALQATAAPPGS